MTNELREALDRAAELAPDDTVDPHAVWAQAQQARRTSRIAVAAVVAVLMVVVGMGWRLADVGADRAQPVAPTYSGSDLGFPHRVVAIPARTPTTEDDGPLGPLALVATAQHDGAWPWSEHSTMAYGVSAVTGEYRFLSLPGFVGEGHQGPAADLALSADGTRLAYPYAVDPGSDGFAMAEGIAVYDTVTEDVTRFPVVGGVHPQVRNLLWSPDGIDLAYEIWELENGSTAAASVAQLDGVRVLSLDDGGVTSLTHSSDMLPGISWKPAGKSPGGIAQVRRGVLQVLDPTTGRLVYTQPLSIGRGGRHLGWPVIWASDGSALVAMTANGAVVRATGMDSARPKVDVVSGSGRSDDVTLLGLGAGSTVVTLGGMDGTIVSRDGIVADDSFVTSGFDDERLELHGLAVSSDALAGSRELAVVDPPQGYGWLDVVLLGGLLGGLVQLLWSGRRQLRSRFGRRAVGWRVRLVSVWRLDVGLLLVVPLLSVMASILVVRQTSEQFGSFTANIDGSSFFVIAFLVWRVWSRGWVSRGLLICIAGFELFVMAAASIEDGPRAGLMAALALASLAVLLSPAVTNHVRHLDP